MKNILFISIVSLQLVACSAEVGSEKWCSDLDLKAKGDWTMNQAKDYAKYCLFKIEQ